MAGVVYNHMAGSTVTCGQSDVYMNVRSAWQAVNSASTWVDRSTLGRAIGWVAAKRFSNT